VRISRVLRNKWHLRLLIDLAVALVIAVAVGAASAWYVVDRGRLFNSLSVGEWTAWPESGSPDADPYSGAMLARSGEVPLGAAEGLAFSADTDSAGAPLTGRCNYVLVGQTPLARLWTLTAYDAEGRLMGPAEHRTGFHSREIVRRPDGRFEIRVARSVQPGNWLPIELVDRFRLVLRLYDTPLATGSRFGELTMPQILREECQ
jgi:hypothetical protein